MGCIRFGGYSTYLNVDARHIRKIPPTWTFEQGASFAAQAVTAWYGLKTLGNLQSGQIVLIHSMAGGVGLYCAKLCIAMGAHVIGTISSSEKIPFLLKSLNITRDQIIIRNSNPEIFGQQLDQALRCLLSRFPSLSAVDSDSGDSANDFDSTNSPVARIDLVMDSLLGPLFKATYKRVAPQGRIVVFGAGSMISRGDKPNWLTLIRRYLQRPVLEPLDMIAENKSVMCFNLIWLWSQVDALGILMDELLALGDLVQPIVGHTFPFTKAKEALQFFQTGQSVGKICLQLD